MSDTPYLDAVGEYVKSSEKKDPTVTGALKRYAKTSGEFAAVGGALGSVFPGVGTALGALVGGGAGVLVEAGGDLYDAVFGDGPKHVKESPEKAERAFHTYSALGGEAALGPYLDWWKLYVAAGRPSLQLLEESRLAEKEARKLAREGKVPPPPPPPPPRRNGDGGAFAALMTTRAAGLRGTLVQASGMVQRGVFRESPNGVQGFLVVDGTRDVVSSRWSS
jgi:hypothetical protein